MELTDRQQEIWDFLVEYIDRHGYPPTVREIGEAVGLASPSTVHAHLANLERAGVIRRDPTKPRALELTGHRRAARSAPDTRFHSLPLLGEIAAGGPLLADQNIEEHLGVPEPLARGGDEFLLRVKGDSMIDAGILDGDFVVVERSRTRGTATSSWRWPATTRRRRKRPSSASSTRTAASGCSPRTRRSSPSTPTTCRSSAR